MSIYDNKVFFTKLNQPSVSPRSFLPKIRLISRFYPYFRTFLSLRIMLLLFRQCSYICMMLVLLRLDCILINIILSDVDLKLDTDITSLFFNIVATPFWCRDPSLTEYILSVVQYPLPGHLTSLHPSMSS